MSPARRSSVTLVLALVAHSILVFGAIGVALEVSGLKRVTGYSNDTSLDYSGVVSTISPLVDVFVDEILGVDEIVEPGPVRGDQDRDQMVVPDDPAVGQPALLDDHPPTNDDFEAARPVHSVPYEARTTTNSSSRQEEEPSGCGPPLGGTLWYRFTPEQDLPALVADTYGSDHPTFVAVYSGSSPGGLTQVGCDSDAEGLSLVPFSAVSDQTYLFQVGAPTSTVNPAIGRGNVVFRLSLQGVTSLVSAGANADSYVARISGDGRHVLFTSSATNLDDRHVLPPCRGATSCYLYVRNLELRTTRLVAISSAGDPANGPVSNVENSFAISAGGRFVAFESSATNLVPDDTNVCSPHYLLVGGSYRVSPVPGTCPDVFVHDRDADQDGKLDEDPREEPGAVSTTRVSVSSTGEQGDDGSGVPAISTDGRFVAFSSRASNLDGDDPYRCRHPEPPHLSWNCADVYLHDRSTETTIRISASSDGDPGNADSTGSIDISAEGRYVAFTSEATNLAPGRTELCNQFNTETDPVNCAGVFVHDTRTGRTVRASVSSQGESANSTSSYVSISADGRFVAFSSRGSNLVRGDRHMCNRVSNQEGPPKQELVSCADVFVHDRDADDDGIFDERRAISTSMGSLDAQGRPLELGTQWGGEISDDGRAVIFLSASTVMGGAWGADSLQHAYVRNLRTGVIFPVSGPGSMELQDSAGPWRPSISADGRATAWQGPPASRQGDRNPFYDVFVHRLTWRS